jgi:hypothetical protein
LGQLTNINSYVTIYPVGLLADTLYKVWTQNQTQSSRSNPIRFPCPVYKVIALDLLMNDYSEEKQLKDALTGIHIRSCIWDHFGHKLTITF